MTNKTAKAALRACAGLAVLIGWGLALPLEAQKTKSRQFRDGVRDYRNQDWVRTIRNMGEARIRDPENTGEWVPPEDLFKGAPYVPSYYLGAALVFETRDADSCQKAQGYWDEVDLEVLKGDPQKKSKGQILVDLEILRRTCNRIIVEQIAHRRDQGPAVEEAIVAVERQSVAESGPAEPPEK